MDTDSCCGYTFACAATWTKIDKRTDAWMDGYIIYMSMDIDIW